MEYDESTIVFNEEEEMPQIEDEEEDDDYDDDESNSPRPTTKKGTEIYAMTKLNVVHSYSQYVPNYIESDGMIFVAFTNMITSIPEVADSNIAKDLEPCPYVDSSKIFVCDHEFVKKQEKTRSGDEIFTVISTCVKCSYVQYSN
ncbi:hypothetical protein HgNV_039 [Homarus gammarus nudivirus]|uniref:Baculoviridae late expression factor 5 C-terminal domain-containing protein n=1 Tax=Homarus gammarus nudivirus TaxID=2509616 RepID=A0A411HB81_9VIRU|nr:hypothetical protein KM727_gp39 [Homarus gammarus nudivirus]QBB28644.1 hypothetical protein HgNV_039 [Homarus gammarus nudivirus]